MSQKPLSLRYIVIATLLGNTLEWYDLATMGFFVPLFSQLFFPNHDAHQALIFTMLVIFCGMITRPFGGILFGYIGDRFGRRAALLVSISLMSIPVLFIGLLPTYWQIGVAAPILLFFLRLLQGVAAGGELPGAFVFLYESSTPPLRGFYGSFGFFGVGLGLFLGGICFFYLQTYFDPKNFAAWGWRVIFLTGAILGLCIFFMRQKLHETPAFKRMHELHETLHDPIWQLLKKYKKNLLQALAISFLEAAAFNLTIPFSLIYFTNVLNHSFSRALHMNLLCIFVLIATMPLSGKLASKIGPLKFLTCSCWAFLISAIPLYQLMHFKLGLVLVPFAFALMLSCFWGAMPAVIAGLFPSVVRFSGVGLGYNLMVGMIGGSCPLIALYFIDKIGLAAAPGILLSIAALIAIIALKTVHNGERYPH